MKNKFIMLMLLFNFIAYSKNYTITREKAIEIALKNSKKGKLKSIEIDKNKFNTVWDVEIWDLDATKEFKIDVKTGKILKESVDFDDLNENPVKNNNISKKNILSEIQIIEIIKKHRKNVEIKEIALKTKYGKTLYEVEVYSGRDDIEYIIDAYTGEIIDIDY